MEVVNVTPEKFMQIITRVGLILGGLVLLWRLPDIIAALA